MISYDEIVDKIILGSLIESYEMTKGDDLKMTKALKKVIRFYSTPDQYKEWKEGLNEPV